MNNKRIVSGNEKELSASMTQCKVSCFGEMKRLFRRNARTYNSPDPSGKYMIYALAEQEVYLSD